MHASKGETHMKPHATTARQPPSRMMSPQFSLGTGLSKLISPTAGLIVTGPKASPITTLTVSLAGANAHSQRQQKSLSNNSRKASNSSSHQPSLKLAVSNSLQSMRKPVAKVLPQKTVKPSQSTE